MLNQRLQECLKTRSNITNLALLEGTTLAFSTKLHGAKIFSSVDCDIIKNISMEELGHKTTATAFSKEHNLLAFANTKVIYIINLQNKTKIQTIQTDDGEIEILAFVPDSPYLVAGTKNGRVWQYRFDAKAQLSRLCSFPHKDESLHKIKNNYVSAFAFHSHYMASSGYGGSITLIKMSSLADKRVIKASNVRINALCFIDKNRLLSGSVDGVIQIHSLKKSALVKKIRTPFTNIKQILKMPHSNYVMVSAESNRLIIIDLLREKIVSNNYLEFDTNVEHILLDERENLFISLKDGTLYKYALPSVDELKSHILHNSLDKAYELLENDPMLRGTREHKRVEVMYEKLFSQAIEALVCSQTQEAYRLTEMFEGIKSKREEIQGMFKDFKHYHRFKTLSGDKKYALAYSMCEKFPSLRRTLQFKKMEDSFKESFTLAQKQILIGREDIAQELLLPYASVVAKKPIIKLLLKQNRDFIDFLKAIQSKNYTLVEKLLTKNELFTQIPSYTALKALEQNSIDEINKLINKAQTKEAITQIKALQSSSVLQEELKELYGFAKLVESLQEAYKRGDFVNCYELIDSHYVLNDLELSSFLEKHWSKLMGECEKFAFKGDIKSIKEKLGELIGVKTRLAKIGDLLRVSFHSKTKSLLANKSFTKTENIIYSYIDIFGLDSEILSLMQIYESLAKKKLAITLDQERVVSRNNWQKSLVLMSPSDL